MTFVCESLNVAITGLHPLAGLAIVKVKAQLKQEHVSLPVLNLERGSGRMAFTPSQSSRM